MLKTASYRFLLVCGVTLLALSGAVSADDPAEKAVRSDPVPKILVEKKIEGRNPQAFARRLSDLLGVEVQLPVKGFPRLAVLPGEWTAAQILNQVAKQMDGTGWQLVYRFRKRAAGPAVTAKPESKLPSAGPITLEAEDVSFPRTLKLIQEAAACVIEPPEKIPPGRFRLSWQDAPLETVLKDLAGIANLEIVPTIRFEHEGDEAQAKRAEEDAAQATQRTLQQSFVANRLQEAYGQDPYSPDFPWENIDRERLARSLAREMDLSPADVDSLIETVRLEGQSRAGLQQQ